jgi:hypothetical protein
MSDRKTVKSREQQFKKKEFAGIHIKEAGRSILKIKSARLRKTKMSWDCSVLCLLHSGPQIYNGPV